MKNLATAAGLALAVTAAFVGGSWYGHRTVVSGPQSGDRKVLYYVDPMNPAHTSSQPGLAPCGMKMEPVYADLTQEGAAEKKPGLLTPGTVRIGSEKQQLMGLRVGTAERKPWHRTVRLLGKVATDETRIYRLNATVDGWITTALPFATGSLVKKDETLATFYSAEFLAAGQALLFALNSKDRAQAAGMDSSAMSNRLAQFDLNLQQYKDSLRNLGMGDLQIAEMIHTRKFMQNINIVSPADGVIIARSLSEGQRFEKGTELFRIADLARVWILADVFAQDACWIRPGGEARLRLPGQDRTFTAAVSATLPQFDSTSRTLKLRLEADNPEFTLKPDMFVDVEFPVQVADALVVPTEAVLDAGLNQTVFVDRGGGVFEPRPVQVGARFGDQAQILAGLTNGERIVVSGNFLLDSESRMKLAAAASTAPPGNPRSPGGMEKAAPPAQAITAKDPVCGMDVDEEEARAAKLHSQYQGKAYYFCMEGCKRRFEKEPERFLRASAAKAAMPSNTSAAAVSPHAGMKH